MATYNFPNEPSPEVLEFFKNKKLKPSFNWADVWKQEHQVSFTVAKAMKLDILQDIYDGTLKAFKEGQTLQQFRKELTPLLQKKGWWGIKDMTDPVTGKTDIAQLGSPRRLQIIYDTNMRTARAAGQWDRVQRSKKTHPYLLYELGPSKEHRKEHTQWQGLLLPADDPFWDTHYPLNGWGCKCRVRQVSNGEYQRIKDKHGTKAPEINTREWTNKRTGEIMDVPKGIDPGWDYNPGKGRLKQAKKQVKQKEQQFKKAQKAPLPDLSIKAPAPFSTVKNVNGEQVNRILNGLGTAQSRKLFNDFLEVHPIKSILAKASEIGGKNGWRNRELHASVGQYLGVKPGEAYRQYGSAKGVGRTNGFTKAPFDVVTVKVRANSHLGKAKPEKISEAVTHVIKTATDNAGSFRAREGVYRRYSLSEAVGQKSPEQIMTTLIHEMGHQVHFWAGSPQYRDSHKAFLTKYSDSNHHEWFAEHFTAWYINPVGVRNWNADAADFIEATLKAATSNTHPRSKGY